MTAPERDQRGFALMELVVVVLILGLVSVMLFDYLGNTTNTTTRATSSVVKENEGRLALRELTEDVRAANRILTAYPTNGACVSGGSYPAGYGNCLHFEIQRSVDSTQTCPKSVITYGIVGTALKKTRVDYAANCTTVTSSVTALTMVSGVENGATPLFRFYDAASALVTSTTSTAGYVAATSIKVNLTLSFKSGASKLFLNSAVALRNNR